MDPIRFELRPQVRKIHEQPQRSLYCTATRRARLEAREAGFLVYHISIAKKDEKFSVIYVRYKFTCGNLSFGIIWAC